MGFHLEAQLRSAEADGSIGVLEEAGAVILQDTCPEVTPYNRNHYNHLMTNSLKAEHYLQVVHKMPTSVGTIQDCARLQSKFE